MLRYHLSILMLVDIIEPVGRCDLLPGFAQAIADAENAVIDALDFSPNNTYAVGARYGSSSKSVEGNSAEGAVTVPLISIDPYPYPELQSTPLNPLAEPVEWMDLNPRSPSV